MKFCTCICLTKSSITCSQEGKDPHFEQNWSLRGDFQARGLLFSSIVMFRSNMLDLLSVCVPAVTQIWSRIESSWFPQTPRLQLSSHTGPASSKAPPWQLPNVTKDRITREAKKFTTESGLSSPVNCQAVPWQVWEGVSHEVTRSLSDRGPWLVRICGTGKLFTWDFDEKQVQEVKSAFSHERQEVVVSVRPLPTDWETSGR